MLAYGGMERPTAATNFGDDSAELPRPTAATNFGDDSAELRGYPALVNMPRPTVVAFPKPPPRHLPLILPEGCPPAPSETAVGVVSPLVHRRVETPPTPPVRPSAKQDTPPPPPPDTLDRRVETPPTPPVQPSAKQDTPPPPPPDTPPTSPTGVPGQSAGGAFTVPKVPPKGPPPGHRAGGALIVPNIKYSLEPPPTPDPLSSACEPPPAIEPEQEKTVAVGTRVASETREERERRLLARPRTDARQPKFSKRPEPKWD